MRKTFFILLTGIVSFFLFMQGTASAALILHSREAVEVELTGFDGLAGERIFQGELQAGEDWKVDTPYRGLALLRFPAGQVYPVIVTDGECTVRIKTPAEVPVFSGCAGNDALYARLAGKGDAPEQDTFASLMLRAKELLDSSSSIRTLEGLHGKKAEFYRFVRDNYSRLRHSDMVRRLVGRSFMMLEYVSYHDAGKPGTDIQQQHRGEVFANVTGWLGVLAPHIPEHEILNYCVGLYYNRSMVTLASRIMEKFGDIAYCPGEAPAPFNLPGDLLLQDPARNTTRTRAEVKGLVALVSTQCPVSQVVAVIRARELAAAGSMASLVVVPMEKLSSGHLAMNRMVSGGSLLFVDDEKWRQKSLGRHKIRLPFGFPLDEGRRTGM